MMRIRDVIRSAAFLLLAMTIGLIGGTVPTPLSAAQRPDQWKKVEEAVNKGLPQTAIKELEPIIASAMKEKAYPEAIKAITRKIALEGNIQGNKPEEQITRMEAEIAKAPAEMKPVMHSILAHWYWHYFQQNRWRFMQRTATETAPGKDFTTWDLPRLFAEIDKQFSIALASEKELRAIPIAQYDALLTRGTLPDKYRPTLFDFVAFEALNFYASPEQAGSRAEDAFDLEAASPALGSAEDFLAWTPQSTDTTSRTLKAIKLYQKLLTIHKDDADPTAYLDADLFRLEFAYNQAVGEDKRNRYKAALEGFAAKHGGHELSALAQFRLAVVVQGEGDLVRAREIALQASKAYPNSHGGTQAHNLVLSIEAPELSAQTERVWTSPLPVIRVQYRNITSVHFRLYKADWAARLNQVRFRPEQWTEDDANNFLKMEPTFAFRSDLPATADYKPRSHDIPAPAGLKPGFYFLVSSHDPNFNPGNSPLSVCDVWVSDLAVVLRGNWGTPELQGFVLNAQAGTPIEGASVKVWTRDNQNRFQPGTTVKTDADGRFIVRSTPGRGCVVLASHNGQELATGNDHYMYQNPPQQPSPGQTIFFTDRSLYRPGQLVQFKGICLKADQERDQYQVLPNQNVTVYFRDVNGQEIAKLATKTNDYGSFSGSFTAPRDRLTGAMSLMVQEKYPGSTQISVEEYKRPKFQATLDAPKEASKLGDEVKLIGKATAYTGAPIGGAKVRYRVVREVRYPVWFHSFYYWRMPVDPGNRQEIAHGTAVTGPDGSFPVSFIAKPDRTVSEKDEPTFVYSVHADVTDINGETRSANRSINLGYTALKAEITSEPWQSTKKAIPITVTTTTLDGEPFPAKGDVKIYSLKQPAKVIRPSILSPGVQPVVRGRRPAPSKPVMPSVDPSNPLTWETDEVVATVPFTTDAKGKVELSLKLAEGPYRAILETRDRFGKQVTARHQLQVVNPDAAALGIKIPNLFSAPKWTLEPGEEFVALWGTGYDQGRAYIEVEHRGKILQKFWSDPNRTQVMLKQATTEAMRGGFTVRVTYVREDRAYIESHHVDIPWTNKNLTVKWERFNSKLEPGKKETWTAVISGPNAKSSVAEMVAAMYDESLDQYKPHGWMQRFNVFRQDHSNMYTQFENMARSLNHVRGQWPGGGFKPVGPTTYRAFPPDVTVNLSEYMYFGAGGFGGGGFNGRGGMPMAAPGAPAPTGLRARMAENRALAKGAPADKENMFSGALNDAERTGPPNDGPGGAAQGPDLSGVAPRKNLNETAFFFPHLVSTADGTVRLEFTMPEALSKWKFLGFAHDRDLRSGFLGGETVTAKDLMVEPNPPRFLREGDILEFSVKVTNQSDKPQKGQVRLSLFDARTNQPIDEAMGVATPTLPFEIPPKESRNVSYRLTVPDGQGPVIYKAVGATEKFSDGEEGMLPVLSRRILVTESIPLPIRGEQTKKFELTKLLESGKSDTIRSQSLTVQMASQPAWYAVMALPYLMEYPYECSEQTFNRLYANALARHVANSDPKIRRVFDQWKNTPALDSPLEKNQDLKSALLSETPWVRDAQAESQARRNIGILFDDNRLNEESTRLIRKLAEMQDADGSFPWFPGGRGNDYISLYIVTGFGRLRHMGVKLDMAPAIRALSRLDAWAAEMHREILRHGKPDDNHLSATIALYLYGRSFYIDDLPIAKENQAANTYWLGQAKKYWLQLANRQSQGHIALGLQRFGDKATPAAIVASLRERSVSNEEMGMFWRDLERSWWWFHAPIETQAVMIEVFDEVANDAKSVEDCKVWLLKQKQTQNWKTTKATADAVYGLLRRGDNLLKSDALVEVKLGPVDIKPEKVEAGTGFYEEKFVRGEVKPDMGSVTVTKRDPGVAWGSLSWQYLEDINKVTPHEGTPLKVEKKLFKRVFTKSGPVLEAVNGPLAVGDEVVVRVVLRTDRDMEYVHLKDHRGSGTEPVNVLSRYKFQDGLAYYESTKDTASHFFIDYLPKGTYVFEYAVRTVHKGKYPTGMADVQCMYAPEFNSHSESIPLEVK